MYLIELDETNRLSLISSFYLKPSQSYSQKTTFVIDQRDVTRIVLIKLYLNLMFLVELDERNIFFDYCLLPSPTVFPPEPK